MAKRTKQEATFQKEVSKLNNWIIYCRQNIAKKDKLMDWNQSLSEAVDERLKLLKDYASNKLTNKLTNK